MLRRLEDPATRPRILRDIIHGTPDWNNFFRLDWWDIRLAYVHSQPNIWMQGLSVHEAAQRLNRDPVELVVDLILEDGNRTTMVNFVSTGGGSCSRDFSPTWSCSIQTGSRIGPPSRTHTSSPRAFLGSSWMDTSRWTGALFPAVSSARFSRRLRDNRWPPSWFKVAR
jgi:hypothetical protein